MRENHTLNVKLGSIRGVVNTALLRQIRFPAPLLQFPEFQKRRGHLDLCDRCNNSPLSPDRDIDDRRQLFCDNFPTDPSRVYNPCYVWVNKTEQGWRTALAPFPTSGSDRVEKLTEEEEVVAAADNCSIPEGGRK